MKRALVHRPLYPARDGTPEKIFLDEWVTLVNSLPISTLDGDMRVIDSILQHAPGRVTQRAVQVAATFVMWLGSKSGACFLLQGEAKERQLANADGRGYLSAWLHVNAREAHVNGGFRAIEHILSQRDALSAGQLRVAPKLTLDDCEVVESVVRWLATSDAQRLIARCEQRIEVERRSAIQSHQRAFLSHKGDSRIKEPSQDIRANCS